MYEFLEEHWIILYGLLMYILGNLKMYLVMRNIK